MNTVQRILVPVDFSERSAYAVKYAASLAQETKAELLMVLHVFDAKDGELFAAFDGWPIPRNAHIRVPLDYRFRDKAANLYNFTETVVGKPGALRIRSMVKMGSSVVREIIEVAKEENIDLIVLAARKKSLFSYLMLRSTFLKLTWRSPCPVLLTPAVSKERMSRVSGQLIPQAG